MHIQAYFKKKGGEMKKILAMLVLIAFVGCGKEKVEIAQTANEKLENDVSYVMPTLNLERTFTLSTENSVEYPLRINSYKQENILGNYSFLLNLNSDIYSKHLEVSFDIFGDTKVENLYYIDLKNLNMPVSLITKKSFIELSLKQVSFLDHDNLQWGQKNPDSIASDMNGKAYIVTAINEGDGGYVAKSTYLFWFSCLGNIVSDDQFKYRCSNGDLKFTYKLIDYNLSRDI